jgi:FKBP-type peptidyl-prolyl cis-trans isomerase SlyD
MEALLTIAPDTVVSIHYTLTLDDGELVDSSQGDDALVYLHGHGNIVPGLESQLAGRKVGDVFTAVVAPEDGYGEHDPAGVQTVPRSSFPKEVEVQPGMQFQAENEDGTSAELTVTEVDGDEITIDLNHPLAGQTLHFEVKVAAIRRATAEELTHGHVHGPHGHHH